MTGLIKLGLAAAAGYAVARYLEGEAQGIPASALWRPDTLLTPVSQLRMLGVAPPAALPQPVGQLVNAALAPIFPWGFAGLRR